MRYSLGAPREAVPATRTGQVKRTAEHVAPAVLCVIILTYDKEEALPATAPSSWTSCTR